MEFRIAVLPGDGIGPEVINQALRLLKVIEKKENLSFKLEEGLIGAVAIDETGNPLPDETIAMCKRSDAVLMGAVGHPKYDMDPGITEDQEEPRTLCQYTPYFHLRTIEPGFTA